MTKKALGGKEEANLYEGKKLFFFIYNIFVNYPLVFSTQSML